MRLQKNGSHSGTRGGRAGVAALSGRFRLMGGSARSRQSMTIPQDGGQRLCKVPEMPEPVNAPWPAVSLQNCHCSNEADMAKMSEVGRCHQQAEEGGRPACPRDASWREAGGGSWS